MTHVWRIMMLRDDGFPECFTARHNELSILRYPQSIPLTVMDCVTRVGEPVIALIGILQMTKYSQRRLRSPGLRKRRLRESPHRRLHLQHPPGHGDREDDAGGGRADRLNYDRARPRLVLRIFPHVFPHHWGMHQCQLPLPPRPIAGRARSTTTSPRLAF